jgi:hypothetical protein
MSEMAQQVTYGSTGGNDGTEKESATLFLFQREIDATVPLMEP